MNKAWKIGTDIYSYLKPFIDKKHQGKEIIVNDGGIYIEDELLKTGTHTTIGQMMRVLDFCGVITKSRKATSVKNYQNGSITFSVNVHTSNLKDVITSRLNERISILSEVKEPTYLRQEFPNQEDSFLFSIAATLIAIEDKNNTKYIEMQMDGTKISDFSSFYSGLAIFIAQSKNHKELMSVIKKWLVQGKDKINDIISFDAQIKSKVTDIWRKVELDKVVNFDTYNLGAFINGHMMETSKIKIPIYQRKYRWSEANTLQLLRDIRTLNGDQGKYHNIGTLITKQEIVGTKSIIKIIDGQQRLTTLMIIVRAAYDIAKFKQWPIDSDIYDKFEENSQELNEISNAFLRIEGNNDFLAFNKLMNGDLSEVEGGESIIARNYYSVLAWLNSNLKSEKDMINFWNSLLVNLIFSAMTDNSSNEYSLFEKLNTGSIPLKVMELVKNNILNEFQDIVDSNETRFQAEFQNKILKHFEIKNGKSAGELDDKKIKTFIINLMRIYGFDYSNDKSLYFAYNNIIESIYKNRVEDFSINNKNSFVNLIKEMEKDIILFNDITTYNIYRQKKHFLYPVSDFLYILQSRTIYIPVIFKLISEFQESDQKISDINHLRELLLVIETYEMRFQVVTYRGQSLGDVMGNISEKIHLNMSKQNMWKLFSEIPGKIGMAKKEEFKERFATMNFSNAQANNVMMRFENFLFLKGNMYEKEADLRLVNVNKISREHIIPQDLTKWIDKLRNIDYENGLGVMHDDWNDRIGNVISIPSWKNSSLGNNSPEEKMEQYTTNESIPNLKLFSGFKFKNIKLEGITVNFDYDDVVKRTNELTNLAMEIWGKDL